MFSYFTMSKFDANSNRRNMSTLRAYHVAQTP